MPRKRKVPVVNQENVVPPEKLVMVPRKPDKSEKPMKRQKREPDWADGDGSNVIKIILSVQKSDCNSNKCSTELTKLYKKVKLILFLFGCILLDFCWIFFRWITKHLLLLCSR